MNLGALVIVGLVALIAIVIVARAVRIIGQAETAVVERLGRYSRTLGPGLSILVPFIDRIRLMIDMREQVVSFPPQPVITEDNLVVSIDSVVYYQVTDPKAATYEIANYLLGIEQLTVTTLRNVIGAMDLEETLTSRDSINSQLRAVLDEATGKWGIRVNRVELKAIDPPASVQESMEKQMRAERDRRAAILQAEGEKQAAILNAEGSQRASILTAEGEKQAAVLQAEGEKEASILKAQGEAIALAEVSRAVHAENVNERVLAYEYLQALPELANGTANKVWVVPAEMSKAVETLSRGFANKDGQAP